MHYLWTIVITLNFVAASAASASVIPTSGYFGSQKRETRERMGPTPVVASPVEDIVPEGAPISDDDSVVSSVYSVHSEPEGEFWDDLDNHVPGPPPQLLIYMRELGRMSFLRETTRTSLLRELQYHLLLILGVGLVVRPASILHQNGFEGTMGNWNV